MSNKRKSPVDGLVLPLPPSKRQKVRERHLVPLCPQRHRWITPPSEGLCSQRPVFMTYRSAMLTDEGPRYLHTWIKWRISGLKMKRCALSMHVGVMKFGAWCDFIHLVYSKPQSPGIVMISGILYECKRAHWTSWVSHVGIKLGSCLLSCLIQIHRSIRRRTLQLF